MRGDCLGQCLAGKETLGGVCQLDGLTLGNAEPRSCWAAMTPCDGEGTCVDRASAGNYGLCILRMHDGLDL